VSRIFLSHSSHDNRQAAALKHWLSEQRPELANEIFLDIDPSAGLRVGQRWKAQLVQREFGCEAVICLLSSSWEASHECKAEYRTLENLGKQILVARLEDIGDTDITSDWQRCDLFADGPQTDIDVQDGGPPVPFNTAALYQLRKAIEGSGVGPENFVWPPGDDARRAPYRGWGAFESMDAGVFFGRDAAITRALDELRAMRRSGHRSLFVVLGPSGSGKSSFLRAGLIPRLQRDDRRFLVLGIMRPERHALTGQHGFATAIDNARQALGLSDTPLGDIENACLDDPDRVYALLVELRAAAAKWVADTGLDGNSQSTRAADAADESSAPTLVLPLDQAEELFSADAGDQAKQFLTLLAEVAGRINAEDLGLIVAATIRTDRYEAMQNHPALNGFNTSLFNELRPMPATQFRDVITGPAVRATQGGHRLTIAPDLVNRLIDDAAEGADTLPLLALTLWRLFIAYASTGELTLAQYEAMGGVRRVVHNVIEEVLAADPKQRASQLEQLRAAFVPWLVTISPDGAPTRRVARWSDLPDASKPLIEELVAKRLLVRDERRGQLLIEVALESLLRQWDELAGWLREERQNLKTADDLERNAADWQAHDHDPAWLLSGTRLTDSEKLSARIDFRDKLADTNEFLSASRQAEDVANAGEDERREADVRHARERQQAAEALAAAESQARERAQQHAATLRRRSRILAGVALFAVVATVLSVYGLLSATGDKRQAQNNAHQALARRLDADAQSLLAGTRWGGDTQAFDDLLAAYALFPRIDDGAILHAAAMRADTLKVADTGAIVYGVAFSPDGHRIATAGGGDGEDDDVAQIWDADTGQRVGIPLKGHTDLVTGVAFSPDGHLIATASADTTVRLWNADTGQPVGDPLKGHTDLVTGVAFSPDGHLIATASADTTVRLWNVDTRRQIGAPLEGHSGAVNAVAFSPDGHQLASGGADGTVRVWNADTGQPASPPLTGHTDAVTSVAFSPDGHRLASGARDRTVRLWNADTGQPTSPPLTGHTDAVTSVAFSPDGHRLATASADATVQLWNVDARQPIPMGTPLTGHAKMVRGVAFSPDGRRLASGGDDDTLRVWDVRQPLAGHTDWVTSVVFSPDGQRLATGSNDDTVRLWNADTGQSIGNPLLGPTDWVTSVAFSPDGHRVAAASADDTVRLWNGDTGQPIGQPMRESDRLFGVAFNPDGHRLATAGKDGTVWLWNTDTGRPAGAPLKGHSGAVNAVAFSPDGHRLASGGADGTVRVWDADTGRQIGAPLSGHVGAVNAVAFSPDGHRLASGGADGTVRVWNADTGQSLGEPLLGHTDQVTSVAFSPDALTIASASKDHSVRLWAWNGSSNTGEPLSDPFTGHTGTVFGVTFSPDGREIATASEDDTVRLWPAQATPQTLCAKLTTNMTTQHWTEWVSRSVAYDIVCPGLNVQQLRYRATPLLDRLAPLLRTPLWPHHGRRQAS
jgi:WD40 repeat protein